MNNLLVTGGCGFIGSNFIRYLLNQSDFSGRIVNLDKLTYAGNPQSLGDVEHNFPDHYQLEAVDLCDQRGIAKVFKQNDIDAICHFAAESHVDRSINSPGEFIQSNIVGTYNLLEQARALGDKLKRFHHVSTDEVFGSLGETGFFTETTSYSPNSPYSASKASSDHLVRAYHETYGLPVTISNCSNNYGPFHFPEKLIPLVILKAINGETLPVYGDGKHVRDWLYVEDHCSAIWQIIANGEDGETYNVGGRNEKTNLSVVETICSKLDEKLGQLPSGPRKDLIEFVKDRPGHDRRYAIDCSKIEKDLGWTPAESFETGLDQTIDWYLENMAWVDSIKSGEYQTWITKQYGS